MRIFKELCDYLELYFFDDKERKKYPKFTELKQLKIIKWLAKNSEQKYIRISYNFDKNKWVISSNYLTIKQYKDFSDTLSLIIYGVYERCTDNQKKEIKDILNSEQ